MIRNLQEALKDNSNLKQDKQDLQKQLAVSDAKVKSLEEKLLKLKSSPSNSSTYVAENKKLSTKVSMLEEELKKKENTIELQNSRISNLIKTKKEEVSGTSDLTENLKTENDRLKEMVGSSKKLYESKVNELYSQLKSSIMINRLYKL